MPTYLYRCLECDKQFEVQQSFTDPARTTCNCEKAAPVKKVFTPVGVTFKGSGFYKTDSRGSSSSSSSSSGGSSSGESSGSSSDTPKTDAAKTDTPKTDTAKTSTTPSSPSSTA